MRQAFVITAYKDYLMLRLICELLCESFKIYVHVDKLSEEITDDNVKQLNQITNVVAIKKYECHWNSYNHLLALVELAKRALEDKDINYVHFSSGEDLPIKSPDEIYKFFENSGNKSYLNFHFPDAMSDERVRDWWQYYHFFYNGCDVRKAPFCDYIDETIAWQKKHGIKKTGLGEFTKIYKGIIWSSLTRDALEFCFDYTDKHPDYMEDIKYTRIREEFYFHTILFNQSRFEGRVIKDGKHGMYWKNGFYYMTPQRYRDCLKQGKLFVRKICSKQEALINLILEECASEYRLIDKRIYKMGKILYEQESKLENHIMDDGDIITTESLLRKKYRGRYILLRDVTEGIPINSISFCGNIKNKKIDLNICGKNLFDPYKNNFPSNENWMKIEKNNVIHYVNELGKHQKVIFGKYTVLPGAKVVMSRDNDNVSIALNELNRKGEMIRQSWLGNTGALEKVIELTSETLYFSIIVTSDIWIKKVDEYVKIQVEYGIEKTDFQEYYGSKIEFFPDSYHYVLPQRIEQKEGLFIWLDNEDDIEMEVDVNSYNATIKTLVDEIARLREDGR